MSATKCGEQELKQLKEVGVLPFKTTVANLIDQSGMETLVKVIDTPEAWEAYRTLWNVTKKAYEVHNAQSNSLDSCSSHFVTKVKIWCLNKSNTYKGHKSGMKMPLSSPQGTAVRWGKFGSSCVKNSF